MNPLNSWRLGGCVTLPETNSSHLKKGRAAKGKSRLQTSNHHFSSCMLVLGRVFFVVLGGSANGKLVVWGPMVWMLLEGI